MAKENYHTTSKNEDIYNNMSSILEVTGNMANAGISEILLRGKLLQINSKKKVLYSKLIKDKNSSVSNLCEDIRNKLSEKIVCSFDDLQILEAAISDIEDQIVENKDKIFLKPTDQEQDSKNDPDNEYKIQFQKEVSFLRNQFKESSEPYKEWQIKVIEKYKELEKIFKKYYPEAWIFMEFCLSVKSILNIMDFTLPFMGVIIAPPSSQKTMVIQFFRKYLNVFYTDGFTSSSLVSHNAALDEKQLRKVDMLPKMANKLVLTPELALFFTGKEEDLQKTMGIITRVLDGHGLENDSGAHGHRKYGNTMFVWLGAAVEIPFRVWKLLGTLGHKIYFIRPNLQKKTVLDLKRIAKSNNFSSINKEIEEALLDYLKVFDAAPEIDGKTKIENGILKIRWNEEEEEEQDKAIEYIAHLANLLAPLRGEVYVSQSKIVNRKFNYLSPDNSSQQEQNYPHHQPHQVESQDYDTDFPIIEDASRAVILLRNLAIGHAVSQGRDYLTLRDVPIAIKVALSTAPVRRVRVLDGLLKSETGVLTTSQICNELSISQPPVVKTMREFDALGIADISAVSEYNNSELQIKLSQEFEWFTTKEFQDLKEDFVPYEKKKDEDEDDDFDNQFNNTNNSNEYYSDNHIDKKDNIDNSITQNNYGLSSLNSKEQQDIKSNTVESSDPCDNNNGCHTLKDDLPPEAQQTNIFSNDYNIKQSKFLKKDNNDLQSLLLQNSGENNKQQSPSLSSENNVKDDNIEKNNASLWGSKPFEHVTMSHAGQEEVQTPYRVSPTIQESDGIKYIIYQKVLQIIESYHGSPIAVNYSIELACKNHEVIKSYLNSKLTPRENRNVRDLVANLIRHPNIDVIKQKPQILVKWVKKNDDSWTNAKEDQII